jgi:hypothetical protein
VVARDPDPHSNPATPPADPAAPLPTKRPGDPNLLDPSPVDGQATSRGPGECCQSPWDGLRALGELPRGSDRRSESVPGPQDAHRCGPTCRAEGVRCLPDDPALADAPHRHCDRRPADDPALPDAPHRHCDRRPADDPALPVDLHLMAAPVRRSGPRPRDDRRATGPRKDAPAPAAVPCRPWADRDPGHRAGVRRNLQADLIRTTASRGRRTVERLTLPDLLTVLLSSRHVPAIPCGHRRQVQSSRSPSSKKRKGMRAF